MPPTNNEAERALRPLVVLRKITFGHRSDAGAVRMARLMTVAETAKRHSHRPSDIYYRVFTRSLGQVLQRLYDGSERRLLSVGDQSLGRYASSVFPGFFLIGRLITTLPPILAMLAVIASSLWMTVLSSLFAAGHLIY